MDTAAALFVYGTLKQGHSNHSLLEGTITTIADGSISGRLYDLGDFPALVVQGNEIVRGEVIWLDPACVARVLSVLDRLEGFDPNDLERSLYLRIRVNTQCDDGHAVAAWTYVFNTSRPDHGLDRFAVLESGVWVGPSALETEGEPAALHSFRGHVREFTSRN